MRCAVIGHPVSHSLSPALHRAGYADAGLDWTYDAIDVAPDQLRDFVQGLGGDWRGLSVTMPHKEAMASFGAPDDVVRLTGVANTLVLGDDGARVYNTDVAGFVLACGRAGIDALHSIAILGNGATARSLLVGAARLGATDVTVCVRTLARAVGMLDLGERLGVRTTVQHLGDPLTDVDMVASTLPADATTALAEAVVARAQSVFDAIYDPWPTPLAEAAQRQGVPWVSGLDLLVGQAVEQFHLLTGVWVGADVFASAGQTALSERAKI